MTLKTPLSLALPVVLTHLAQPLCSYLTVDSHGRRVSQARGFGTFSTMPSGSRKLREECSGALELRAVWGSGSLEDAN